MNCSETELESQEKEIRKMVLLVLVPIAIMMFIIVKIQDNSLDYNRNKYLDCKNKDFKGTVISKREEGDYTRAGRFVALNPVYEHLVQNETYYKIQIGDSVAKIKGNDTTFFYLKTGEILFEDGCKFTRERYENLLKNNSASN